MSTTLLDLTQDILSDVDGDEVNSISETTESLQVARHIKVTFQELSVEFGLNSQRSLVELDSLADPARPTHMTLPSGSYHVDYIEYDVRQDSTDPANYKRILYLEPLDFLAYTNHPNQTDNILEVTDIGGTVLQVRDDVDPTYYTSFDNTHFVFDAYDSNKGATLIGSRMRAYVTTQPDLVLDDETVIPLPPHLIPLLRAEARVTYMDIHKGGAPSSVVRVAYRARSRADRIKNSVKERRPIDLLPNYGRRQLRP